MSKSEQTALVVLMGVVVLVVVGGAGWFLITYKCVASHEEQQFRTSCTTVKEHTRCHTYPVMVTVCDQWKKR